MYIVLYGFRKKNVKKVTRIKEKYRKALTLAIVIFW